MGNICHRLHGIVKGLERNYFPYDKSNLCENGLYILFEKGEHAHNTDRIVRIGTHNGPNQLPSRIKQHFLSRNKDRSIFRKNIGRAYLNKNYDPFLEQWNWSLTSRKNNELYSPKLDLDKQQQVEALVSDYIQNNFSFVVFRVDTKEERLKWEEKIISTVSHCEECSPAADWFGQHSPKLKIRESGLWQVNGLYKDPLNEDEFIMLSKLLKRAGQ